MRRRRRRKRGEKNTKFAIGKEVCLTYAGHFPSGGWWRGFPPAGEGNGAKGVNDQTKHADEHKLASTSNERC